jgi:hypothetical protein
MRSYNFASGWICEVMESWRLQWRRLDKGRNCSVKNHWILPKKKEQWPNGNGNYSSGSQVVKKISPRVKPDILRLFHAYWLDGGNPKDIAPSIYAPCMKKPSRLAWASIKIFGLQRSTVTRASCQITLQICGSLDARKRGAPYRGAPYRQHTGWHHSEV